MGPVVVPGVSALCCEWRASCSGWSPSLSAPRYSGPLLEVKRHKYGYESTGFKGIWGPPLPYSVAHYKVGQGCSVPIASLCLVQREEL